ncbi:MAG TPA: FAD-dependent oxidoreductase, partial [Myxococcota bacterium]|nr:FAD-dependent oxidoreductase [Myxococcota bacterium]
MKLAIVGGGISGLACALRLGERHEVTLFEASSQLGGHANTVTVAVDGRAHAVDTGFIVYNETTYPELTRLFGELGVATQPSDMSFSVACERTGLEWSSRGLAGLFATPARALRPAFLRMLREILRFERDAQLLFARRDAKVTLRDYLSGRGYSSAFSEWYALPLGAAIWSAGNADVLEMPALGFARFLANHGMLGRGGAVKWRTVTGGSRRYVDALAARSRARFRCGERVLTLERSDAGVRLIAARGAERFERAIVAVHADAALAMLAQSTALERSVLGAFRYSHNDAVLHTDETLLARRARARASWNSVVPREPRARVLVSYDVSRLQNIAAKRRLLVTLNGADRIDPHCVVSRLAYAHPIL